MWKTTDYRVENLLNKRVKKLWHWVSATILPFVVLCNAPKAVMGSGPFSTPYTQQPLPDEVILWEDECEYTERSHWYQYIC